jgi:hypothetical protein
VPAFGVITTIHYFVAHPDAAADATLAGGDDDERAG